MRGWNDEQYDASREGGKAANKIMNRLTRMGKCACNGAGWWILGFLGGKRSVAKIPVYQKSHGCETTGARVGGDAQLLFTKRGETFGGDGRRKSQDLRKVHGRDSRRFRYKGGTAVVVDFGVIYWWTVLRG